MNEAFPFDLLPDGSLVLALDGACIQSTARHAHRALAAALLEGRTADRAVEAPIELLGRFLGTTDFAALRAAHPELLGQTPCRVRLHRHAGGGVRWEVVSSR